MIFRGSVVIKHRFELAQPLRLGCSRAFGSQKQPCGGCFQLSGVGKKTGFKSCTGLRRKKNW